MVANVLWINMLGFWDLLFIQFDNEEVAVPHRGTKPLVAHEGVRTSDLWVIVLSVARGRQ